MRFAALGRSTGILLGYCITSIVLLLQRQLDIGVIVYKEASWDPYLNLTRLMVAPAATPRHAPRVVLLSVDPPSPRIINATLVYDDDEVKGTEIYPRSARWQPWEEDQGKECRYINEWQSRSYPTCSSIHELPSLQSESMEYLGSGSFRTVWKISDDSLSGGVLKTLNFGEKQGEKKEKSLADIPYMLEKHRVDSIAMERLASSAYIVDEYAFCGNSVVTEALKLSMRKFLGTHTLTQEDKLELAIDTAKASSTVHSIDDDTVSSLIHCDLHGENVMMHPAPDQANSPKIKLNDFNQGVFGMWDADHQACKYKPDYAWMEALCVCFLPRKTR